MQLGSLSLCLQKNNNNNTTAHLHSICLQSGWVAQGQKLENGWGELCLHNGLKPFLKKTLLQDVYFFTFNIKVKTV